MPRREECTLVNATCIGTRLRHCQDAQMLECFLNLPRLNDHGDNPLNYKYLAEQQLEDKKLQELAGRKPDKYITKTLNGHKVLCYVKTYEDPETQW